MDKVEKFLGKLTSREREHIRQILRRLNSGNFAGLDIKKLKGREDIFRVRRDDIRIVYRTTEKDIFILTIERRSEKTYRL